MATVFEEIAEELTKEEIKLLRNCSGIQIEVGNNPSPISRLATAVGIDLARKIRRLAGGVRFYIPNGNQEKRLERNKEIIAKFGKGRPARMLAKDYNLTERSIWKILKLPIA